MRSVLGVAIVRHVWRVVQFRPSDLSVETRLLLNAVAFGWRRRAHCAAWRSTRCETDSRGPLFTLWRVRVVWVVKLEGQLFGRLVLAKK